MTELQLDRLLLLLALFTGLYSVNGTNSKRGCLGDAVQLFQNISFNSSDTVVSIYKNIDSNIILGMWQIKNDIPSIINGQSDRISLDKKGNIWILNLQESDEGTYAVKIERGGNYTKVEMSLVVSAAPTNNCKPKIIRVDNSLIAQVKANECGRPTASVSWLEHPGIFIERNIIKLKPGRETGIYHACIEGDALLCAKISNVSDYCSFYKYNESESLIEQIVVEGFGPSQLFGHILAVIIIILVMTAIILIFVTLPYVKKISTVCHCIKRKSEAETLDTRNDTGAVNPKKFIEQVSVEEELHETEGKSLMKDTYQMSSGASPFITPVHPDDDSAKEESHEKSHR